MYPANENIYETVYNIVLNSGNIHEWKEFSTNVLDILSLASPFDEARIYFYNGNSKVYDQYLVGAEKKWANAYHEYYSKIENGRYSTRPEVNERLRPPEQKVSIRKWEGAELINNEFYQDYVKPQQIKITMSFTFFDMTGSARSTFMLDRTTSVDFTDYEIQLLRLAYPQLNNLHKNFFNSGSVNKLENIDWKTTSLTSREIDVTTLLCQGVSPHNISRKLHITVPTVNKHIAHIYAKMQVSSRQELLVRVLNH